MHYLDSLEEYQQLLRHLSEGLSPVSVTGITESARADFISALLRDQKKNGFVIVESMLDARVLKEDLEFYFEKTPVEIFPARDYIFHNIETADLQLYHKRIELLERIARGEELVVVAPLDAVLQYTLPPELMKEFRYELAPGVRVDIKNLLRRLTVMGYKRSDTVEGAGQMSLRGGILDIFPPGSEAPLRVEFFDDEVDTLRYFSPETQLSDRQTERCVIGCCRELVYEDAGKIIKKLSAYEETEWTDKDKAQFEEAHYFPAVDRYLPLIYPRLYSVVSYLQDRYLLFLDFPSRLQSRGENYEAELENTMVQFAESGALPLFKGKYCLSIHDLIREIQVPVIAEGSLSATAGFLKSRVQYNIQSRSLQSYQGRVDMILEDIKYWRQKEYAITILAGSRSKAEAFHKTVVEQNFPAELSETPQFAQKGEIVVSPGSISRGFEYPLLSVVVISSRELFGSGKHRRRASTMPGVKLKSYADLSVGDYVVHQVHGIGQYLGMQRMEVDHITRDYLKIQYRGSDVLYVPATALDTVNKYISNDGREMKLNKMGGAEFSKVKSRVKKSLEDIADRLVALYAARNAKKGFAFSPDTDWQKNFEDQFPYEETPDQLKCIEEMKADMESGRPMDRLLCGDVGFGKTEVALRGAFKAVMDSKQVAYLVPTTILAQQHYNTFLQRMRDFPIKVEMMSRFRTPKQQKEIAKKVATGEVDVLIGTHRILQKDVAFKDLGLLIIDEEQRFGVKHKEIIKEMKQDVDVLTLSATPIPRTLHMSLTGVRDMSVIAQPPEDRYPVQTYILEYDKDVIRDAVLKELGRNGQVYYVFNRVEGIYKVANDLQEMAPGARIAVGHGQMSERELESVMIDTLKGEVDILVCTTIIETGLDISNINTIIIENADCMGLSQLYQLRGRVGRSNRLAYAYLTYRKDKILNETATKRLTAIREFTEFGSGFKIAMRDLEIRGAGNMLGAQQHGEMDAVGYDMYCKLLEEAVSDAKGEPKKEEILTSVDIKSNTFIPESYIPSHNLRIEAYKRIAATATEQDRENMIDELIDRFGQPPESVMNLIEISLIRTYANKGGISDVVEKGERILLYFDKSQLPDTEKIAHLAKIYRGQIFYNGGAKPYMTYVDHTPEKSRLLENLKKVLYAYQAESGEQQ